MPLESLRRIFMADEDTEADIPPLTHPYDYMFDDEP